MLIVGLMSGTSADGVDAALCQIEGRPPRLQARVLAGATFPYEPPLRRRILAACSPHSSRVDEICRLSFDLAERFAEAALEAIRQAGQEPSQIDLIGSHGQTVWHQVDAGRVTSTLQIGEASVIAERTGITTVSNFRARDVSAGGQGAPLTGYADWLLLRHPERWRAVQNIGGIANVTFLPPLSAGETLSMAFDTGPGNALIDALAAAITDGRLACDRDGQLALAGHIDEPWLGQLLAHPYFGRRPPKTTGRELFGEAMAARLLQDGRDRGLGDPDIVATITALTARSIAQAYRDFAPAPIEEVILGGGGARNPALVAMLRQALAPVPVRTHEDLGLDGDLKEALVFALLAHETWHDRPGVLPALTGAQHATVLGQITPGANFRHLIEHTWRHT
ncbi:MAG: anhydro-N-acetylmuramic acid kinase [Anaerolineae bacterium]|jgi:anhydro-N-acetylmuramic acid kinase